MVLASKTNRVFGDSSVISTGKANPNSIYSTGNIKPGETRTIKKATGEEITITGTDKGTTVTSKPTQSSNVQTTNLNTTPTSLQDAATIRASQGQLLRSTAFRKKQEAYAEEQEARTPSGRYEVPVGDKVVSYDIASEQKPTDSIIFSDLRKDNDNKARMKERFKLMTGREELQTVDFVTGSVYQQPNIKFKTVSTKDDDKTPVMLTKPSERYSQYEARVDKLSDKEKAFYGSQRMQDVKDLAKAISGGEGKNESQRSKASLISEEVSYNLLSAAPNLYGAVSFGIPRIVMLSEAATIKETRQNFNRLPYREATNTAIQTVARPSTLITAAVVSVPTAATGMVTGNTGFGFSAGKLTYENIKLSPKESIKVVGLEIGQDKGLVLGTLSGRGMKTTFNVGNKELGVKSSEGKIQPRTYAGGQVTIKNVKDLTTQPAPMFLEGRTLSPETQALIYTKTYPSVKEVWNVKTPIEEGMLVKGTRNIDETGGRIIVGEVKKDKGIIYGSKASEPQLLSEVRRTTGDYDAFINTSNPTKLTDITLRTSKMLESAGYKTMVPEGSYSIEVFMSGEWNKVVEYHGRGGLGNTPDQSLSESVFGLKTGIERDVTQTGGVNIASISGETKRKFAASSTIKDGKLEVSNSGRVKDYPDLLRHLYSQKKSSKKPTPKTDELLALADKLEIDYKKSAEKELLYDFSKESSKPINELRVYSFSASMSSEAKNLLSISSSSVSNSRSVSASSSLSTSKSPSVSKSLSRSSSVSISHSPSISSSLSISKSQSVSSSISPSVSKSFSSSTSKSPSRSVSSSMNNYNKPPPKNILPYYIRGSEEVAGTSFDVFVKRKGSFIKIGEGYSKRGAEKLGARETLRNLAATYKVIPSSSPITKEYKGEDYTDAFREYKIRNRKIYKTQGTFIQRTRKEGGLRGGRLGTRSEVGEIQSLRKYKDAVP